MLFVTPAYLILLARGIARLTPGSRRVVAALTFVLVALSLPPRVTVSPPQGRLARRGGFAPARRSGRDGASGRGRDRPGAQRRGRDGRAITSNPDAPSSRGQGVHFP